MLTVLFLSFIWHLPGNSRIYSFLLSECIAVYAAVQARKTQYYVEKETIVYIFFMFYHLLIGPINTIEFRKKLNLSDYLMTFTLLYLYLNYLGF